MWPHVLQDPHQDVVWNTAALPCGILALAVQRHCLFPLLKGGSELLGLELARVEDRPHSVSAPTGRGGVEALCKLSPSLKSCAVLSAHDDVERLSLHQAYQG